MKGIITSALLLTQAQTVYYFTIIGVGLGYPKPILLTLILVEWLTTLKLLDKLVDKTLIRGLAIWLAFSPIFLLPSAISLWRVHLYGFNPSHIALTAAIAIPLATLYIKGVLKKVTMGVAATTLFALGATLNIGVPIYTSAILSIISGINLTLNPARRKQSP
ncbi:MAG: hypothetical protein QW453_05645 [Thermoprotei archaeon]